MPIRFPTQAANADVLGDDTPMDLGAEPARPRARSQREHYFSRTVGSRPAEGKPGRDINAAGFVKDKDSNLP